MGVVTREVHGNGMVIGMGFLKIPWEVAEGKGSIPSKERVDQAKKTFVSIGIPGGSVLIDAVLMHEKSRETVAGYLGFTVDRERVTRKPLAENETHDERGMKIMSLPHPQFGHRSGSRTVIGDLVAMAESSVGNLKLKTVGAEDLATFSAMLEEAASFFSEGVSGGRT